MVMEAAPPASLEMIEAQLILEFLIVALDAPAQFGEADEPGEGGRRRQRREPVFRGLGGPPRPLDQQPFFRPGRWPGFITMGGSDAQPRKAGVHGAARPFAPGHRTPRRRR